MKPSIVDDPLYPIEEAISNESYRLPLSWVVKWSAAGMDPIHAAWNASENPMLMELVYYYPKMDYKFYYGGKFGHGDVRPGLSKVARKLGVSGVSDFRISNIQASVYNAYMVGKKSAQTIIPEDAWSLTDKTVAAAMHDILAIGKLITLPQFLAKGNK